VIYLPPSATQQQREAFEERAAIIEFCANVSREVAEEQAYQEIFGQGTNRQLF
jgi:hypothetical protein